MDMSEQKQEIPAETLFRVDEYHTADGRIIRHHVCQNEDFEDANFFTGRANVQQPGGGVGQMEFPILGAATVQQAVEIFHESGQEAVNEMQRQRAQPKIAVPGDESEAKRILQADFGKR